MIGINNLNSIKSSHGILYINIFPVIEYPTKIKISRTYYNENFTHDKWRKRIGSWVYYYGHSIGNNFEQINIANSLFGKIFRKYLLDLLSENISSSWYIKKLSSILIIAKEITDDYDHSNEIKLEYVLKIGIHHWQNKNFGVVIEPKINIYDRESNIKLSYLDIKNKYNDKIKKNIWYLVQSYHKHLTHNGKKYGTAMYEKFNLIENLTKEAFESSDKEKTFISPDGNIKISFEFLKIVEVENYDAI